MIQIQKVNYNTLNKNVWTYITSMVGINSEAVLPSRITILEVMEINVEQIRPSKLVVFAVEIVWF